MSGTPEDPRQRQGSPSTSSPDRLVGWKVGVQHFTKASSYFKFGVFTAIQRSVLNERATSWLLKCAYDDLSHDWFESTTADVLLKRRRIVLIKDCKSEAHRRRRERRRNG